MSQPTAAAKRSLGQFHYGHLGKAKARSSSTMKSSMTISTPHEMFHSSRTRLFMVSSPSYYSSLPSAATAAAPSTPSLAPPLWTSLMDKLLQRNPYLKCLESAGILLPTSSSADFAYSHLDESTSRLLAQPHYAQAAAQQLVDMYQQDYSKLKDTQHELSLQHLYSLEIPLASLVQLMKLSQHLLTDNSSQHPALWHATLHRDISMQLDQIRRNSEYGKIAALAQQQGKTSKTTTTTTTCTDRTKEQDMQWETKYMMHQLLQRQSSYQEQDDHDHDKNNDVSGSNRLDWQEALLEVQHDLLTTTTIHWQPHHYEHNPMEFRYKLKNRAQRSEIIRNFYNLIGLRQTLATTKTSASTNNDDNRQQEQPYKHYVDQVFRNDCRQRLAPSVESVESFLKTTSRQLKAYINATSSALPFSNVGGALSEFLKPQRHEQLILRRQQQQQQQPSQTNDMNDAVVNNDDVLEELQQDIEDQQQYKQKDVPDEEKMLQLHHHVTLDGALDLVFRLSQDLFGIAIVQDTNKNDNSARFWNADIRLYHIYNHNDDDENKKQDQDDHDDSQQHYLGSFFLDPYQRSGKMHGWTGHIPLYAARRIANGAAAMDSGNESAAGHAVVVLSLQLEPPVWSDDPARITWQNARDLFSQLGYAYQWILSTKSSSLIMSLAKSPANMSVDLVPVIPKFMEHWLYEKSTIYGLLAASAASLSGSSSSLAEFTDGSMDAAHRVLTRRKALELSRHVYYATLELQLFSNLDLLQNGSGGGDAKEHETIMALQNRLAREMLPDELFSVLCDNEDDLTPLCHVLCSDAVASDNHHFSTSNAVSWYRHVWADAVSAHMFEQLQNEYDKGEKKEKMLVMKRWREKFRTFLLDRGAAVDVDEFKREFGLQDVLSDYNNNANDDDTKEDSKTRPSLHDALFRRYKYHIT